jgi:hypothetical protein
MAGVEDLGGGVWRWVLPHPEWRPRSEVVGSYAVRSGEDTVLIDPLLGDGVAGQLDAIVDGTVTVAVTIPYHVRSAAEASERWDARIVGHPDLARRLPGLAVHDDAPARRAGAARRARGARGSARSGPVGLVTRFVLA